MGTRADLRTRVQGELFVVHLLKRTYEWREYGRCRLSDEQEPLHERQPLHARSASGEAPPPAGDVDFIALRPGVDVVVQGAAYTVSARQTESSVSVEGPALRRTLRVIGDRVAEMTADGCIRFSAPRPFRRMPVRYDRAYGGHDAQALARYGDSAREVLRPPVGAREPTTRFHYPRNPSGTGFVVEPTRAAVDGRRLPNLEFPDDPLTPARLACGHMDRWPLAPLPAGLDWYGLFWFPRSAYLGMIPRHAPLDRPLPEVRARVASEDLLAIRPPWASRLDPRAEYAQGASPGMTLATLRADASFRLRGFFPDRTEWVVRLPGEVPRVAAVPSGRRAPPVEPRLNSVVFQPERRRMTLTWAALVPADAVPGGEARVEWESLHVH
ncbi:MAG: DUF2169 domain-containing protein [Gemmatimonadetes bacterium]|nr:DUF2169 domain-containing protein [Gemmatimonadota bacterium]